MTRSARICGVLVAGALCLVAGAAPGASSSTPEVKVPGVVGKVQTNAECALRRAGLRWRYRGSRHVHRRPSIPCDRRRSNEPDVNPKIDSQRPRRGRRVARRTVIVLTTTCGPGPGDCL